MTPDKNDDDQLLHEDTLSSEGAEAEVWQDDQPPEDDFTDVQGESSPSVEETVEAAPDDKNKKRGTFVMLGGLVAAAALVGGLLYVQFGSSSSSSPSDPMIATTSEPTPSSTEKSSMPPVVPSGTGDATSQVVSLDGTDTHPVGDARPAMPAAQTVSPDMATAAPPPLSDAPTPVPQQPAMPPIASLPAAPAIAAPPSGVPSGQDAQGLKVALDAKIVDITSQINAIRMTLTHINDVTTTLTQDLQSLQRKTPSATSVDSGKTTEIAQRIEALERKVQDLAKTPVVIQEERGTSVPQKEPTTKKTVVASSQKKTAPSKLKATAQAVTHKTAKKAVNAPKHEEGKAKLVLRAAVPGEAWVASSAYASDLRSVKVGDSLAGVGTIKSIEQDNGAWVIKGSAGMLR